MVKVLCLIALVLLSGFSGGNDVIATAHPVSPLVFDVDPSSVTPSMEARIETARHPGQDPSGDVATTATECCLDSACGNASHCHHSGLSAMMAAQSNSMSAMLRGGYQPSRHEIPTQSVAHSISKPPRA